MSAWLYRLKVSILIIAIGILFSVPSFAIIQGNRVIATASLNVRSCASTSCSILTTVATGSKGLVVAGPTSADGFVWWRVSWDSGTTGWSVQDFMAVIPGNFTVSGTPYCNTNPPPATAAVSLSWTSASGATSYQVYRNGSFYANVGTSTTFDNNLNVTAGQTYSYFIRAVNSNGTTDSNTISVPVPANVCAGSQPPGNFTLSGNPYCNTSPLPATAAVFLSWSAASGASSYQVYRNGSFYANAGTSRTFDNNLNVTAGQTYSYFIRAVNSNGTTDSNPISVPVPANVCAVSNNPDIRIEPLTLSFNQQTPKPIYVEIDWMEDGTHSHKPSQSVINRIVQTFAAAGYEIHLDVSNAIAHQTTLPIIISGSSFSPSSPAVQAIMSQNFNHAGDSRYYYSIWGHNYSCSGCSTGSSGIADLPGRVHLVTLGTFSNQVGTFNNQVGTFIHEFGHNMGQLHGGTDSENYKPNYLSIMNYHYQLNGIGPSLLTLGFANTASGFDDFSYSHGLLPALNQSNLDEGFGIGLGKAVDWNCNGTIQTGVAKYIINKSDWCSASGTQSVITDFDNWAGIASQIRSLNVGGEAAGPLVPCITAEENRPFAERIEALRAQGLLPPDGPPEEPLHTKGAAGHSFLIFNDGSASLSVSSMSLDTATSWIHWEPQASFTVAPGKSQEVLVFVDFSQAPAGQTTRRLLVQSNDSDESPYPGGVNLVITGLGSASCYTLTLSHTGSGGNPVAAPANSSGCGTGQYHSGESIQLTASPSSGWSVGSWSGTANDASTSTTNTVTMPAGNQTVTVNYVQAPPTCYTLTRTHTGAGLDPTAFPVNSTGCPSSQYTAGASIQVTASPSSGWSVGSWSGTINNGSTATTNTVTMPAGNQTVIVNYVQAPPTCFTLTRTHTGSGLDPTAFPGSSTGCPSGQYTSGASIQVTASPSSGWSVGSWSGTINNGSTSTTNSVTMPAGNQTVTVNYVQAPPPASILLVDDDDNDPDVRSSYTAALDALGRSYSVWDTNVSDNEPGNVALQSYQTVIWFTGGSFGGAAGPGASGEADLSSFLSGGSGRCVILSSQDYLFDRGITSFMTNYLGLSSALEDMGQTTVQGQGSAFSGLGPYSLSYPFANFSDQISPAAGAEVAFSGNQGNAAISRIGPNHRTIFLGFPFEALPTSQARQDVMAAALDYCATIFADVPPKYWARKFIEAIYRVGVTTGCASNPRRYCPDDVITRGSMAQFLIAAKEGPSYVPPPCTTSSFSDVAVSSPLCPWIQELVRRGVTAGCGGGQYCPNNPVTRSQMAVFLLSTWHGAGYAPAPCTTAAFNDVPMTSPFCPWIREMVTSGITAGCGGGNFCTESQNTRAQLAVFLTTTFGIPLQ